MIEGLKLHHIGCAVSSIEESLKTYRDILGYKNISQVFKLESSGINACFIELTNGVFLELIEPSGVNSVINTYLKKGVTYYHLGYEVNNIDKTVSGLLEKDFREITTIYSPAFNNRKCVFLFTPELQMIELIDSE